MSEMSQSDVDGLLEDTVLSWIWLLESARQHKRNVYMLEGSCVWFTSECIPLYNKLHISLIWKTLIRTITKIQLVYLPAMLRVVSPIFLDNPAGCCDAPAVADDILATLPSNVAKSIDCDTADIVKHTEGKLTKCHFSVPSPKWKISSF